jgi:hypothetical protein
MIRTLIICAVVSASALGCSATPQPRPDTRVAADTPVRPCSVTSASRLPSKPGECSATPGRTYSQEDVQRTGQTNVGDALQMLDPSINVHH